jgi:probable F420-dependent oxidoreductase
MRLGIALPHFPALALSVYRGIASEAEARGYDTAWVGETAGGDAVTVISILATATERLRLATGVIPVQTRTPVTLGMTAATLGHLAPGRFTLGLGLSSRAIVADWHGLPFSRAVDQVREAVQIIRMVASGERVSFDGRFYRVRNFRLGAPPPPAPARVVLAALGPRMLELAGEIADGVLLNWLPPEAVPACLGHLEAGARKAGRSLAGFEIAAFVRTHVTDEPTPVRAALARDITGYATADVYASVFRAIGYAAEIDALSAAWRGGDRAGAVRQVSARMLDGLGVVGPEAFCRERVAAFARAGLTMPVVVPFAPGPATPSELERSILRTLRAFP